MTARLAIQLYSVRDALAADLAGTVARLAEGGFRAVEVHELVDRTVELSSVLAEHGFSAPSGHGFLATAAFPHPTNPGILVPVPSLDDVFAAARAHGVETVIDPYTAPARWATLDGVADIARALNVAAARAADLGLRVGDHHPAHELVAEFGGRTGLDVLADLLDERVVIDVDAYWVARAGRDPAEVIRALGPRAIALHVKDGTLDPDLSAQDPPRDQVAAGRGVVPLDAALAAATDLELAIIEFDTVEGDVFAAIGESLRYLEVALRRGES